MIDKTNLQSLLRSSLSGVSRLWREGNRRQFVLRGSDSRTFLRVPLTLAVLFALFLLWKAAPLLIVAIVVAFVLKVQFVITKEVRHSGGPGA